MRLSGVLIEDHIKEKIFYKHAVHARDIEEVLFNKPYFLRLKENRYMGIGKNHKILTIIFEVQKNIALIITAYPSTDTQRKLYKHKVG